MSGYPLGPLLRIRKLREQAAAAEMAAGRRRLEEAGRILQQRRDELAAYGPWRIRREEDLFAAIKNRLVSVSRIDEMKAEIAALAAEEQRLEELVLVAEKDRDEARMALDQARAAHARTVREEHKIVEHRSIWNAEQRREAERVQDLELEEVPSKASHAQGFPLSYS